MFRTLQIPSALTMQVFTQRLETALALWVTTAHMALASQESAPVELIKMNLVSLTAKTATPTTTAPGLVLKLHMQPATQASTVSQERFTSSLMTLLLVEFVLKAVTASVVPNIPAHLEPTRLLRV
jgi:hypothetical protein